MAPPWLEHASKTPPLVKWSGGKTSELAHILPCLPGVMPKRVIEPFFGGGALGLSLPAAVPLVASDISQDLMNLYGQVKSRSQEMEPILRAIDALLEEGTVYAESPGAEFRGPKIALSELATRLSASADILAQEFEASISGYLKRRERAHAKEKGRRQDLRETRMTAAIGGIYRVLRSHSHKVVAGTPTRAALFWFVRDFAFNGMHRFNQRGEPNVPYGGASYNKKRMLPRLQRVQTSEQQRRLLNTEFLWSDFGEIIDQSGPEDWLFLDPPYDSPFASYDGNQFNKDDHIRLARHLRKTPAKWLMVIGVTDFVINTYSTMPGIHLRFYPKKYRCNIKNRHGRETDHALITNY